MTENLNRIDGVEIFAIGTHNGDTYDTRDLDDMVSAFNKAGFTPPLKAGHDDTPGRPAIGWIENVRRAGTKLIGDITNIPAEVYTLIRRRGYDTVSAEIYWNLKNARGVFRRALKAVALLGADVPAVATLRPLHQMFSDYAGQTRFYEIGAFEMTFDHDENQFAPELAGQRLNEIALQIARAESLDYSQALARALRENPELAHQWHAELPQHPFYRERSPVRQYAADDANPADVVNYRATRMMEYDATLSYSAAVSRVLKRDPELAKAYDDFQSTHIGD